jgi:hypothetical protein
VLVTGLRAFVRNTLDAPARNWLAAQDRQIGGPKRLSRGIEQPIARAERPVSAPARKPAVATS